MAGITALLHTQNDGLRVGRCLETLYPCDEILIIDYGSDDGTVRVAQEYGARVVRSKAGAPLEQYLRLARTGWILSLDPRESLTEGLAASLFEWKSEAVVGEFTFSMFLREETVQGWIENPAPQTRLVPIGWERWEGRLPANEASALVLEGELLRFVLP
jgi:glycosyltransferase involved in cell wall biosynthesis